MPTSPTPAADGDGRRTTWPTAEPLQQAADLRRAAGDPLLADWLDATANALAWLAPYRDNEPGYGMWEAALAVARQLLGTSAAEGAGAEPGPDAALREENTCFRATLDRVRSLHDALEQYGELTSPEDEITRGAAAERIAAALDGRRTEAAAGMQPPTSEADARTMLCSVANLGRIHHAHNWQPQPGMPLLLCPGRPDWSLTPPAAPAAPEEPQ